MCATASTLISGVVLRHDDHRAEAEVPGRVGHALGVIAGARGDDAPGPLLGRQVGDLVVRPAQLEAEDGLEVFALQENGRAQTAGQARRQVERASRGPRRRPGS